MADKSIRYTPEFKRQMVGLVRSGRTPASLSKEFGSAAWLATQSAPSKRLRVREGEPGHPCSGHDVPAAGHFAKWLLRVDGSTDVGSTV
jgi:hypothetical protein